MDGPQVSTPPRGGSILSNYAILAWTMLSFAAMLITLNALIGVPNIRWDLTPSKRFSLSDFDKKVLGGLTHPVKVMAFVRTEDPAYLQLSDLLFQAAAFTPRLTYQVIDVNKAPGLAREYGVSSYGEVIVESHGHRRDFDNARSDLLIPAVLQASQTETKHIYFTLGHGERDLYDSDRSNGYSQWRTMLLQNNYEIDNLSLFAGGVPEDCRVLIALGPKKDFLPEELASLAAYLGKGGKFIAIVDPFGSPSLVTFLKKFYLDFTTQVLVDPEYRLSAGEILTTQVPIRSETSAISRAMVGSAVFSLARGIMITGSPGQAAPDNLVFAMSEKFLQSSHESWISGDEKALTTGITEFKSGRDIKGPIPVGVEVDFTPANKPHIALGDMTRIAALGTTSFASNQFIEMLGNRDLAVNIVNELAGDQMMIASRERLNTSETAAFYVTDQQARNVLMLGGLLEPLLMFGIGATVFVRRRFFA